MYVIYINILYTNKVIQTIILYYCIIYKQLVAGLSSVARDMKYQWIFKHRYKTSQIFSVPNQ